MTNIPLSLAELSITDWVLVALYMCLVLGIGIGVSLRHKGGDAEDAFLGGRNIPTWATGLSFLATTLSAATFIGGPAEAFSGDLSYLILTLSTVLGGLITAFWLLPACYKSGGTTVYALIGQRISTDAQRIMSGAFLSGRFLASGARLMIVGTAMTAIVFPEDISILNVLLVLAACGTVGTLYSAFGGIRAIVWTDTLQLLVLTIAVGGAVWLLHGQVDGGIPHAFESAKDAGKLKWLNLSPDPTKFYTVWSAIAWTVFVVAAYGCDQDMAQRLLSCKSPKSASKALLSGVAMNFPVTLLFLLLGVLLWVFYQNNPDAPIASEAFPHFITHHMNTPLRGLMVAGLLAAAMSSFDSASGAIASCLSQDFNLKAKPFVLTLLTGSTLTVIAGGLSWYMLAYPETSLIKLALGVMTFAYSGMLGVFICVLLFKRGTTKSVLAALIVGALWICFFKARYDGELLCALALPWQMVIATTCSTLVCSLGIQKIRSTV